MTYFISIDTYKHEPRFLGIKKWWKEPELRPVTLSIVSAGGETFSVQFKATLKDDPDWDGISIPAPDYDEKLHEHIAVGKAKEFMKGYVLSDTFIADTPDMLSEINWRWSGKNHTLLSFFNSFDEFVTESAASIPDAEFAHENLSYPTAMNLLPGEFIPLETKIAMLHEHDDWVSIAPGALSLERARATRNNYLLLKRIVDSHKKPRPAQKS